MEGMVQKHARHLYIFFKLPATLCYLSKQSIDALQSSITERLFSPVLTLPRPQSLFGLVNTVDIVKIITQIIQRGAFRMMLIMHLSSFCKL